MINQARLEKLTRKFWKEMKADGMLSDMTISEDADEFVEAIKAIVEEAKD